MMSKESKDELTNLKSILNEIENLEIIRKLEMDQACEIYKKNRRIRNKKKDILEELDENLSSLRLRNTYLWKTPTKIAEATELKNAARKKLNEIDKLGTELKEKE